MCVAVLVGVLSCAPVPATASPAASATTAHTATASANPTATPPTAVTPLPSGPLLGFRATTVPTEFRYIAGAELSLSRIWLADLATGRVVDVAAQQTGAGRNLVFSASADGKHLAVAGPGPSGRASITILDVELGRARSIYEDPELDAPGFFAPALSPDGSRVAYATGAGVRLVDVASSAVLRTIPHDDPQMVGGMWRPIAWSSDATWLALGRSSEGASEIAIVDAGRELRRLGTGLMVSWRAKAPELLVMNSSGPFGGQSVSYTYDLATNRGAPLERAGTERRASLAWHPTADRYLYIANPTPVALGDVFTRSLTDAASTRIDAPRSVEDAWWSRDGSKIYALLIRQDALRDASGDANYEIVELPGGRIVATVCRGDPRAVCP